MIKFYKYLPHGKPIPKGWKLANKLENTRHGHHAVLIVREDKNEEHNTTRTKGKSIKDVSAGNRKRADSRKIRNKNRNTQ